MLCQNTELSDAQDCLADEAACQDQAQEEVKKVCQSSGGGDCADWLEKILEVYTEACAKPATACCFCQCVTDSQQNYDEAAYAADGSCVCVDWDSSAGCLGMAPDQVEACLLDEIEDLGRVVVHIDPKA